MKKMLVIVVVFLSACASSGPKEKPLIYEDQIVGKHAPLAYCIMNRLQSDNRWSIRMLQFSNHLYPDIDASAIYAHDMRFLPGIFARNSPTNPDAVFDHPRANPEIRSYEQSRADTMPPYTFALMIKKIDDSHVMATLRGSRYAGAIAWEYLRRCTHSNIKPRFLG